MTTPRKAPSAKTLRELYVLSGNLCAKPKCNSVLVNAKGTLVGEVCHIKAEKPGGARFDKTLDEEARRAPANLILLCRVCHKLVDSEPKEYTISVLTKWKRDREQLFAAVGETLRQKYMEEISDEAKDTDLTFPKSLKSFVQYLDKENYSHTVDENTLGDVIKYIEKLRHVALPERTLIKAIVEKALALGGARISDSGISIHPDDLKTLLINENRISDYRIQKLAKTLERNELGYLDVDEEPTLKIAAPDVDLDWSALKLFLESQGKDLRDIICDLKFGFLD